MSKGHKTFRNQFLSSHREAKKKKREQNVWHYYYWRHSRSQNCWLFSKRVHQRLSKKIMDISTIVMPALIVPFFSRVGRPKLFHKKTPKTIWVLVPCYLIIIFSYRKNVSCSIWDSSISVWLMTAAKWSEANQYGLTISQGRQNI